jgi:hypothetical protein
VVTAGNESRSLYLNHAVFFSDFFYYVFSLRVRFPGAATLKHGKLRSR